MQPQAAEEGKSFVDEINFWSTEYPILRFHFGWIFNAYTIFRPFFMKIFVKYLRYSIDKMALQFLITPMDEVITGYIFVQVSFDLSH